MYICNYEKYLLEAPYNQYRTFTIFVYCRGYYDTNYIAIILSHPFTIKVIMLYCRLEGLV